jgi:hypothetical protein
MVGFDVGVAHVHGSAFWLSSEGRALGALPCGGEGELVRGRSIRVGDRL